MTDEARLIQVKDKVVELPFIEDVKPVYIDEEGSSHYDCPICRSGDVKVKDSVF